MLGQYLFIFSLFHIKKTRSSMTTYREPGSVPSFKWSIFSSYYSALLLAAPGCYASDSRTQKTLSLNPDFWKLKIFWLISIYQIYLMISFFSAFFYYLEEMGSQIMRLWNYIAWESYSFFFFLMYNSSNHGPYLLQWHFCITFSHIDPPTHVLDSGKAGMCSPSLTILSMGGPYYWRIKVWFL